MADPTQQKYPHFARRLAEAMKQAKLNNSDVARQVWGDAKDGGARNRDRIGHYLRGTSHPEPPNLQKLADALGVSPDYLAEPGNAPRRPAGVQRRGEGVVPGGTQLTITLEQ